MECRRLFAVRRVSHDFDLDSGFRPLFDLCHAASMTSIERMYALYQGVEHVVRTGIAGALVECGVWRGGSAMMMALAARHFGDPEREIWLYDTFAGMTPPDSRDVQAMSGIAASDLLAARSRDRDDPFWGISPRTEVEANLLRVTASLDRFRLVEGDVCETIPAILPERIALLRLDTDWYESTLHELEHLYPRLEPGGVLIVDDYGYWQGARLAVDHYFTNNPPRPLLHRIDFTGRIAVKGTVPAIYPPTARPDKSGE